MASPYFDTRAWERPGRIYWPDFGGGMGSRGLSQEIDAEVLLAARQAARRFGARFVIGWWIDGFERKLMLLPKGHPVTAEPPFVPLLVVSPTGPPARLAA